MYPTAFAATATGCAQLASAPIRGARSSALSLRANPGSTATIAIPTARSSLPTYAVSEFSALFDVDTPPLTHQRRGAEAPCPAQASSPGRTTG